MRRLAALLVIAACGKSAPDPHIGEARGYLARGDLRMVAYTLDQLRTDGDGPLRDAAPELATELLAHWEDIRSYELKVAEAAGVQRARGHDPLPDHFAEVLPVLAAGAPAIEAKWTALAEEIKRTEAASHTKESADPRPLAQVIADKAAIIIAMCSVDTLAARLPSYRWELAIKPTASVRVNVTGDAGHTAYKSTTTDERSSLVSGLRVTYTPVNVTGFPHAISAQADADAPETVSGGIGGRLAAGGDLMDQLEHSICGSLDKQLSADAARKRIEP